MYLSVVGIAAFMACPSRIGNHTVSYEKVSNKNYMKQKTQTNATVKTAKITTRGAKLISFASKVVVKQTAVVREAELGQKSLDHTIA